MKFDNQNVQKAWNLYDSGCYWECLKELTDQEFRELLPHIDLNITYPGGNGDGGYWTNYFVDELNQNQIKIAFKLGKLHCDVSRNNNSMLLEAMRSKDMELIKLIISDDSFTYHKAVGKRYFGNVMGGDTMRLNGQTADIMLTVLTMLTDFKDKQVFLKDMLQVLKTDYDLEYLKAMFHAMSL